MTTHDRDTQLERLAALNDPVRRALYFFVAARPGQVSRDQAARGIRISRALAAFHLDKLVDHGLLETSYRRLGKRRGPGAGRPAKLYRRSDVQLQVSLPPREYELAARLFAGALVAAPPSIAARVRQMARNLGIRLGRDVRRRTGKPPGQARLPQLFEDILREYGYEPFAAADGTIQLRNCPFEALARDHRALVCNANLHLLRGLSAGLGMTGTKPQLESRPGQCCVAFRPARKARAGLPRR
jgi:predicted ArsR family transcriptional regulator